jgi:Ran GTPase-activating protein (RanGAP) involved in mRNA processing and transport
MSMIVKYFREDANKNTPSDILNYLSGSKLKNVEEIDFEGTFGDNDVVSLCNLLTSRVMDANVRILRISQGELTIVAANALATLLSVNASLRTLDLRHNSLGANGGIEVLIQPLITINRTLRTLILKDNKVSYRDAMAIAMLLSRNETLTGLNLDNNLIAAKGIRSLAPNITLRLQQVHLAHNGLKARGIQYFVSELKKQRQHHNLEFLDLTCNDLGPIGMASLSSWLLVHQESKLKHLWLGSNNLGSNCGSSWGSILEHNFALLELRLGGNQLGDDAVQALSLGLGKNHGLQRLELDYNQISNAGAEALAMALQNNHGTLRYLNLGGNSIQSDGGVALAQALPYMLEFHELNLANNVLDDVAIEAFVTSLSKWNCALDKLCWEGNPISTTAAHDLELALQYGQNRKKWFTPRFESQIKSNRFPVLNWLTKATFISNFEVMKLATILLSDCCTSRLKSMYLGGVNINEQGIIGLAEWIGKSASSNASYQGCCFLTRLFLQNTTLRDEGIQAISKALESNTTLREISLTSCHITYIGASALGRAIKENNTLVRLNLAQNRITIPGLINLLEGIQHSCSVTSLNVTNNQLFDTPSSDEKYMWELLAQSSSLCEISLRNNQIVDSGIMEFAHALRNACHIRFLDLSENSITDKGAWLLSRTLEDYQVAMQI